jgi:two-component system sensor histidine kinase BaeS
MMNLPIRLRLSLNYLVVLLIGMGLAAALAWVAVERLYLATQRENLLAQAQLTAAAIQDISLPIEPADPYLQTSNVQPGIHTRLLSDQGAVLVGPEISTTETLVQVPLAENTSFVPSDELLQRTEIQQALQGKAATAVRRVASAGGRRVLYAAAPVQSYNTGGSGIVYLATPLPVTGLPVNIILQFGGAVVIAMILASYTGTRLARRMATSIERLDRAARAISDGDLSQNVTAHSGVSELETLGQAFNTMTASLHQSDQAKNAFIADVTHELRTPLTVIKGTIETLEDGAIDDLEGRGPLLVSMQRETDRLIRLVNELLVLTRADASALQLKVESLDLEASVRARCEHLATLATLRQVSLEVVRGDPEPRGKLSVRGDPDRLAQVLDNLLDNAIRHAPEGSTVKITTLRSGDEVQCEVCDQGTGIPEEHLPFLFERFYRVDASRNRQTGGTGLGLAIVQALLKAQQGRIVVQSTPGTGTTFTFWLPAGENCHPTD